MLEIMEWSFIYPTECTIINLHIPSNFRPPPHPTATFFSHFHHPPHFHPISIFISQYHRLHLFVNLLRRPGIDSRPGGIDSSESIPGLLKRLQIRTPCPLFFILKSFRESMNSVFTCKYILEKNNFRKTKTYLKHFKVQRWAENKIKFSLHCSFCFLTELLFESSHNFVAAEMAPSEP